MATGLVDIMKQAAIGAVDQSKPVNLVFGTVIGIDPLVIQITPNLIIYEEHGQLKVTRQCTDYETTDHVMIRNKLEFGDTVIMGRVQGGQQYIVFDKVG